MQYIKCNNNYLYSSYFAINTCSVDVNIITETLVYYLNSFHVDNFSLIICDKKIIFGNLSIDMSNVELHLIETTMYIEVESLFQY